MAQEPPQSVRFSGVNEEIESSRPAGQELLSPQADEELRNLSASLQTSRCQARRMENFAFEPVSAAPSRVSMCGMAWPV
jgi:hypothetical protein